MLAREIWAWKATLSVAASVSPPQRASGLWLRVLHLWIALVSPLESLGLPCPDMSIFRTDNWAGSPIGGLPFPFYCPGENQETWVCFYSELTEYNHTSASSLCSSGRGASSERAALSLGGSGRVNAFMSRKCSGVTGDATSVIGLVGDVSQSGDSEYIRTL